MPYDYGSAPQVGADYRALMRKRQFGGGDVDPALMLNPQVAGLVGALQQMRQSNQQSAMPEPPMTPEQALATRLGQGIHRTAMGSPGAFHAPVSMEDTRRAQFLAANRPQAMAQGGLAMTPEQAKMRLLERASAGKESASEMPFLDAQGQYHGAPGSTTPIDQAKAGPARERRATELQRRQAIASLNAVNRKYLPLPVAQDMAFMNYVQRLPPQQAAALLTARMNNQGANQRSMFEAMMHGQELGQRGALSREEMANRLAIAGLDPGGAHAAQAKKLGADAKLAEWAMTPEGQAARSDDPLIQQTRSQALLQELQKRGGSQVPTKPPVPVWAQGKSPEDVMKTGRDMGFDPKDVLTIIKQSNPNLVSPTEFEPGGVGPVDALRAMSPASAVQENIQRYQQGRMPLAPFQFGLLQKLFGL